MYLIGTITQQLSANSHVTKLRPLCVDMGEGGGGAEPKKMKG